VVPGAEKPSPGATWLVDVHYPEPTVAGKIAFATKVALVQRGIAVSDRMPSLAAGDVRVLSGMGPTEAYPVACQRYRAEGALADGQVLLAVTLLHPQETQLHAGVCAGGVWRWVR
jgi:hypothetical protein